MRTRTGEPSGFAPLPPRASRIEVREGLAHEVLRDDVGHDRVRGQRGGRAAPDRGDLRAAPKARASRPCGAHPREEPVDPVLAGERDEIVGRELLDGAPDEGGVGRVAEHDRRDDDGLRAPALDEARGLLGLALGARDEDALAEEGAAIEPPDGVAQGDDGAHDDERGVREAGGACLRGDLVEAAGDGALLRARAPVDDGGGGRGVLARVLDEAARDVLDAAHAHEHADGPGDAGDLAEVERLARARGAAHERDAGGEVAVGEGDARVRGDPERRGDAGHDLERDARGREGLGLLGAAAEQERIAALEAHDAEPRAREIDERGVDLGLLVLLLVAIAAALADARTSQPGFTRARSAGWTSSSWSTTSAAPRSAAPRRVRSSGSPGPCADEVDGAGLGGGGIGLCLAGAGSGRLTHRTILH